MKNILIVNVNWLGDIIFSTPVFKALKRQYPQAVITCLGVPRVREVLECAPGVDRVLIYDEKGRDWNPIAKLGLILKLRREKFDAAFLLHRSMTRALLVYLAGIPVRVGYDIKAKGPLLTHRVPPAENLIHRSDHYLKVIESFGVKVSDRVCELNVDPEAEEYIARLFREKGIVSSDFTAVVNTGGNWDLKRWPQDNFIKLIGRLAGDLQAKVIIPGGKQDVAMVENIARRSGAPVINLAGQTNLKQLAALMKKVSVVICADSGPLHVADSVGANTVALFGPTKSEMTGPRGQGRNILIQNDVGCNREPCYHLKCPDNVCMKSIDVEQVLDAVRQFKAVTR